MSNTTKATTKSKVVKDAGKYLSNHINSKGVINVGNKLLIPIPKTRTFKETARSDRRSEWIKRKSDTLELVVRAILGERLEEYRNDVLSRLFESGEKTKKKITATQMAVLFYSRKVYSVWGHT